MFSKFCLSLVFLLAAGLLAAGYQGTSSPGSQGRISAESGPTDAEIQCASATEDCPAEPAAAPRSLKERWGVEPVALRLSAGGYMLDFRYRILDPGKAGPIVDHSIKPVLVHRESGAEFMVPSPPKVGSLRQTSRNNRPPIEGRVYFVIFANPGRYIEAGDHVDVVIGDFKADNLVVE